MRVVAALLLLVGAHADSDNGGDRWTLTLAGNTSAGAADGPGASATLDEPTMMAEVFGQPLFTALVADQANNRLRLQLLNYSDVPGPASFELPSPPTYIANTISTYAGAAAGYADGTGSDARFTRPYGVASFADFNSDPGADRHALGD